MTPVTSLMKACPSSLFSIRTLHLFTLCSFAVTEPLLTALARQTVYIHDQQFGWFEIGALLTVLMVILPLGAFAADQIVLRLSRYVLGRGRNTVFVLLFAIILLSLLRPYVSCPMLLRKSSAGLLALVIAIPGSWLLIILYERAKWLRFWLTIASVGLVIFPGMFLCQFQAIRRAETSPDGRLAVNAPVPVVFVVFDEFSGTTLMNERMEIDAQRFPQFARLAECSTWYRNTTTVSPRTDVAVPAILAGRFPVTERSPLASEYPGNLLQLIESTKAFEMAIFEPITRLCPSSVAHAPLPDRSSLQKCADILKTLAAVYPRLIFTSDTPVWFPIIPKTWFGVRPVIDTQLVRTRDLTEGLFHYAGSENRRRQQQHFLNCLKLSDRPRFCFLHAVFPHFPWCFLPSGEQYFTNTSTSEAPAGGSGELGEDWLDEPAIVLRNQYRYRLQVGYADRFIGQMLDRLKEIGVLDQCLLIVTADHGVSFRAGHSRRLPDADNLPDIMSVPLFIKLPGQTEGHTDDRNVESVDLLPTVAEVLGIELPEPVDGIPVSRDTRHPRKTLYFQNELTVVEPDFPQRTSAIQRQFSLFGNDELDQPPAAVASHLDWHGRPVASFPIEERAIPVVLTDPLLPNPPNEDLSDVSLVPIFVTGKLNVSDLPETPADLVVAVDGVIRDTGKSYRRSARTQGIEFLLPRSVMDGNRGHIDLYLVDRSQNRLRLRPLKTVKEQPNLSRFSQSRSSTDATRVDSR